MTENNCEHLIANSIDKASDLLQENPELAKSFFNKIGWAVILFSISSGVAAATWGIYFLTK